MNYIQTADNYLPLDKYQQVEYTFIGKPVRVIIHEGNEYYIALDITRALGYNRPDNVITRHVNKNDVLAVQVKMKSTSKGKTIEQKRVVKSISRAGLFSLIIHSTKPITNKFEDWITHEVLPTLQDTGTYTDNNKIMQALPGKYVSTPDTSLSGNENTSALLRLANIATEAGQTSITDKLIDKALRSLK